MKWLEKLYSKIWYCTEFAATPVDRRPWTFIMRDYIFTHPWWAGVMITGWYSGLVALQFYCPGASLGLGMVSSFILAHVVWGEKWLFRQQEEPPYQGD